MNKRVSKLFFICFVLLFSLQVQTTTWAREDYRLLTVLTVTGEGIMSSGYFIFEITDETRQDTWSLETFTITGTAENGTDYTRIKNTVNVPIGDPPGQPPDPDSPISEIRITAAQDNDVEGPETVTLIWNTPQGEMKSSYTIIDDDAYCYIVRAQLEGTNESLPVSVAASGDYTGTYTTPFILGPSANPFSVELEILDSVINPGYSFIQWNSNNETDIIDGESATVFADSKDGRSYPSLWALYRDTGGTPGPYPLGDANSDGAVDIIDALLVAQYYVGLNPRGFARQDVNCDGSCDIIDALVIAQYYVGLIDSFC